VHPGSIKKSNTEVRKPRGPGGKKGPCAENITDFYRKNIEGTEERLVGTQRKGKGRKSGEMGMTGQI